MFEVLNGIDDEDVRKVLDEQQKVFYVLMGKHPNDTPIESMIKIWLVPSKYISKMYRRLINKRQP